MAAEATALICLDTSIVAGTKADQALWILTEATKQRDDIVNRFALLDVVDDETKVAAEKGVVFIRGVRKGQDEQRKEWGRPFDLAKKAMDQAMHGHIDDPEKVIEEGLVRKAQAYARQVEEAERQRRAEAQRIADEANAKLAAERKAAEDKARAEAEAAHVEFVPPPVAGIPEVVVATPAPRILPKAEGISYRRVWLYEVEDIAKVPDAYTSRVVNDEAVKNAIKAATVVPAGEKLSQCTAAIPGIKVYHEDRPVVGGFGR
jgi:hypothetical protein